MSAGNEWVDRVLAGLGGVAAFTAWDYYQSGDMFGGTVGVVLVLAALWLCAPLRTRRMSLGDILSEHERERFIRKLSAVYGVDSQDPILSTVVPGGWDPFGTPIVWCRVDARHEPHLWENLGPAYAPVLCMGHQCENPDRHMVKS
jgi:hypothetical protein